MKDEALDAFQQGIDALGFVDGYAVIGLKMILRKIADRYLVKTAQRRKEILKAYNYRYYREHKVEHREYMRKWRRKRLHGVTSWLQNVTD